MDNKIIANLKSLGIDMIDKATSGHPGIVLSAAPLIYTIYAKHMNISTVDPTWINRDRFVMSAGHGSALLYATLFMAGYGITEDDLKNFRRTGFKTPGHPEYGVTPGVDASTGPLGQGIATAVGMAIAEKKLGSSFTIGEKPLFNYHIYALCGDGDMMEGINYEAASLAGTLNLDNLIVLYDSNNISLDGDTSNTFTEKVGDRFKAMGWHTAKVVNGTSVEEIDKAICEAKKAGKPALIEVKTILGNGSELQNSHKAHGKCLEKNDIANLKRKLMMPDQPFYIGEDNVREFRKQISARSQISYELWARNLNNFKQNATESQLKELDHLIKRQPVNILNAGWEFANLKEATRVTNGKVMQVIRENMPTFIGGSADLASSTNTYLDKGRDIREGHYNAKNIWFGVREHAMGAIANGLALSNFTAFASTFLTFSDYLKPAIRMSALMNLPVNYIFTHDSINIGPDGPTHQPIEQLAMLRSIPNLDVFRPADANEIVGSWNTMLNSDGPNAIVLSRQEIRTLPVTVSKYVQYGAYPVRREHERLDGIITATGSELHTALLVAEKMYAEHKIDLRVISMPCMELFQTQPKQYQDNILPAKAKRIVIEAGCSFGWYKYATDENHLITIDRFGISGTKGEVENECNFEFGQIMDRIRKLF